MAKYKLFKDDNGVSNVAYIQEGSEKGTSFPFVVGNRDYDEYKIWLDAGNTPEAAD